MIIFWSFLFHFLLLLYGSRDINVNLALHAFFHFPGSMEDRGVVEIELLIGPGKLE